MQLKSGDKTNLHPHISGDVTCTSRQVAIIIVFTRLWMDKTVLHVFDTHSTNVLRSGFTLGLGLVAQDQVGEK